MARLSFRCDDELLAAVDVARGDVPRELWLRKTVQRAVEQAPGDAEPRSRKLPSEGEPLDGRRSSSPAPAERSLVVPSEMRGPRDQYVQTIRSSSQSKRDVRPIPKKGER